MNFLRNIDDERSNEELEDVFVGADERVKLLGAMITQVHMVITSVPGISDIRIFDMLCKLKGKM